MSTGVVWPPASPTCLPSPPAALTCFPSPPAMTLNHPAPTCPSPPPPSRLVPEPLLPLELLGNSCKQAAGPERFCQLLGLHPSTARVSVTRRGRFLLQGAALAAPLAGPAPPGRTHPRTPPGCSCSETVSSTMCFISIQGSSTTRLWPHDACVG